MDATMPEVRNDLDPQVRAWLRLEGLAAFVAGALIYGRLDGDWVWFIPAQLLVDASAIGYLRGAVLGAIVYNFFHNWATALAVLGVGLATQSAPLSLAGAILVGHVGADRAFGFGLKLPTGFRDTHLGRIGR